MSTDRESDEPNSSAAFGEDAIGRFAETTAGENYGYLTTPYLLSADLTSFLNIPPETALTHVEILSMIQCKCLDCHYAIDPTNRLSVLFSLGLGSITVGRYFSVIDQHLRGPPDNVSSLVSGGEDAVALEHSSVPDADLADISSSVAEVVSESAPAFGIAEVSCISIVREIGEYIAKHSPKLYILTPCFGGQCFVNFVTSLLNTKELFASIGFTLQVEFVKNDSLVSRARNNLVARAMNDPKMTHIIFIDSDIAWDPVDILKLVLADKPVIGGVYPLKKYFWDRLIPSDPEDAAPHMTWTANKRASKLSYMSDTNVIQAKLLRYNVNYLNGCLTVDNGLAGVKHVATGFMMIQRSVFTQMFDEFPLEKYTDDVGCLQGSEHDFAYALFNCGVQNGHYFSEDWLFCDRWTKIDGKIWVDVGVQLMHTGVEDYTGSYLASLVM
jgi:hypothetical protein